MRPGVPALPRFSLGGFLVPSVAPGPSGGGLVSLEYASRYSRGSFSPIRQKAHSHISYFIIDHTFTSFRAAIAFQAVALYCYSARAAVKVAYVQQGLFGRA